MKYPFISVTEFLLLATIVSAAPQPRTTLKTYFETGDIPTQAQFEALIDSYSDGERRVATTAAAGAVTLVLDSDPIWATREGKIAVGVGLNTCELREVASIAGATLTLNSDFYHQHVAGERVIFFGGISVPTSWWGMKGSDTSYDNRYALQCALRAISIQASTHGAPLTLDGQWRDYWLSGPVTLNNGTEIVNQRWRAMTGGAYTGPMDGPENVTYETNAMVQLGQVVLPYTYNAGTNVFTILDPDGAAVASSAGVNSRIIFDSDPTIPSGLVSGRTYFAAAVPSSSTFTLKHTIAGSALPAWAGNGSGWCHIGILDNVKLYSSRWWLDGSNVGLFSGTAVASTDVITTSAAHGLSNGDAIRLTYGESGTFVTGLSQNVKYYARDVTGTTLKVAATAGGTAINITADGVADVRSWDKCLNGAILGMQQPSQMLAMKVEGFKGFGIRVLTQQSYWQNLQLVGNGTQMEFGGESSDLIGEFIWVNGADFEIADHTGFLFRVAKSIHIEDIHIEETGAREVTLFDLRSPGIHGVVLDGTTWITASANTTLFKVQTGVIAKTNYTIKNVRGTFALGVVGIDDRDRGTYLKMEEDFGLEGWAEYSTWSTGDLSRTDPHPYRWDGVSGQSEWRGSGLPTYPYKITRHGALKTSDIEQWKTWDILTGTITLSLAADTFTRTAHGFVEGQEIFLDSGSSQTTTGIEAFISGGTIYRVRNPSADAFQISHTPVSPVLNFTASANLTNWTIKSVAPVRLRIDKDARIINKHNTAVADADLAIGEATWYFDPAAGTFTLKGKKNDGTTVTASP